MAELSRPSDVATEEAVKTRAAAPARRLDIISHRNIFFLISLIIIVPGIVSMVTRGFLLGIDFQGGSEFFISFHDSRPALQAVETAVAAEGVNGQVQQTSNGTFIIRTSVLDPTQAKRFTDDIGRAVNSTVTVDQQTQVGGTIAGETVTTALLAIIAASALILFYLAFRFRRVPGGWQSGFQFGGSALLALLHDVFLLTGIFSILGRVFGLRIGEIDSFFLTAVLTVVGFSVHDTIVVFDRIRENMVVSSRLTFEQVVNLSIMQTAARSIITSFTVVLVLLSLFLFGGDTLKGFALALLIGIISGTYSSIFNASPLLVVWRRLQPVR
ncbi:MAG: protein translocase subunit SecF [Chloroflexi bacterium]|nr:MAG: protein translocase subunit SecF [Chloroflexota bacterium]